MVIMSQRQSSVFDSGSTTSSCKQDKDLSIDDMTEEELRHALEDTAYRNQLLVFENDIFERYLARQDPQSLQTIAHTMEKARRAQRVAARLRTMSSSMSISGSLLSLRDKGSPSIASVRSGSRYATPSVLTTRTFRGGLQITLAHRMEMANREIELLKDKLAEFEKTARNKRVCLKAELEEIEIRMRELEESRQNFETEIVIEGAESITGKIPAERVIRFIEEWLKTMDAIMERLRLKSATIKSQINKAKQQLLQREELGEALHAVDFEQLNIENQDFIRKIDEKNQYVLEMKKIAGRYSLELTRRKETLNELFLTLNRVKKEIIIKQQQIEKLQSEHAITNVEVEKVKEQLASLLKLMDEYWVPEVLDFVKLQAKVQELQKTHKGLFRRKKIQELTVKANKNQLTKNREESSNIPEMLLSI